jgi:hypothetical protein
MKSFWIFTAVFLFVGVCSVAAQDLIILKDGNVIEAKVTEISQTEIRYKRFDHLDGPTIVISSDKVLSIRYQNGKVESINAAPAPEQKKTPAKKPTNTATTTAMDTDKFIFAMNTNAGSFISGIPGDAYTGGPTLNFEFGKGRFNSEVNLIFPLGGGFGGLATFNWFKPNRVGGFYLGGGIGLIYETGVPREISYEEPYSYGGTTYYRTEYRTVYIDATILTGGLNIGWKFVTRSGLYFRTGAYLGIAIYDNINATNNATTDIGIYLKPDLAIGYCFK